MIRVWTLYLAAVGSAGVLVSGADPSWLFVTAAILCLTSAIALLVREAARS